MIIVDVSGIEAWWAAGEQMPITLGGAERAIFVRRLGAGSSMTLLHGFPSCSYDWATVAGPLAEHYALLLPDLLGFGASDKPTDHDYSIHEQADLVEALWAREGVTATTIVAHDYSVTVTQELLARRAEGALAVDLIEVHLLNGGLYPDLHRPEPVQTALLDPQQGPQISAGMTAETMAAALAPTFAPHFDQAAADADIWRATERGGVILHKLIALHTGPQDARAALGAGARDDRRSAGLRVGDARPDLGRSHRRADPPADPGRAVRRARGRGPLAAARVA